MITPTPAPKVRNPRLLVIPYAYALALAGLAAWQLVMFDDFTQYLGDYWGTGVTAAVTLVAISMAGVEVFALPFLLRLHMSPLARCCSALLGFLVPLVWAAVAVAGSSFSWAHLLLTVIFFSWGAASFWVLGGPRVMRLART